jgi:hypothetical protein
MVQQGRQQLGDCQSKTAIREGSGLTSVQHLIANKEARGIVVLLEVIHHSPVSI